MNVGIQGITKRRLLAAWREIRSELRRNTYRDVLDHLEYDIDPEVWISTLLRDLSTGQYAPQAPEYRPLAKSKGFSRLIAYPHIPDLVLYRACVDGLYARALRHRREHLHVYFERGKLAAAQEESAERALPPSSDAGRLWRQLHEHFMDYESGSTRRYRAWLGYTEYRRQLIFERIHPFIVCTDITNYFDSIRHAHVAEALNGIRAPSKLITLLFRLLEEFCYRGGLRPSPAAGLPVDECDCSRKLAHMVLFEHDDRMVEAVGEPAYLRWMDDQTFGAPSRRSALLSLATCGASLASLHLAPNGGKTAILTTKQAKDHFHLEANAALTRLAAMSSKTKSERRRLNTGISTAWASASRLEGEGHWDKIIKRFLLETARAQSRRFRRRATNWVLQYPSLTLRIADYMRVTGTVGEYLDWVKSIWTNPEQIYPDVNVILGESLLRLEPADRSDSTRLRAIPSILLNRQYEIAGIEWIQAIAPLLVLRHNVRRSLRSLKRVFDKDWTKHPRSVVRSAATVYASFGPAQASEVRLSASKRLRNYLGDIVILLERIQDYKTVPHSYRQKFNYRQDPIRQSWYFDTRSMLAARLLRLAKSTVVQKELRTMAGKWASGNVPDFDRRWIEDNIKK